MDINKLLPIKRKANLKLNSFNMLNLSNLLFRNIFKILY